MDFYGCLDVLAILCESIRLLASLWCLVHGLLKGVFISGVHKKRATIMVFVSFVWWFFVVLFFVWWFFVVFFFLVKDILKK